jgi:type VI secretion system secreted protein VgrG
MDANHPYRPARITEKPVIDGLQTATVVTPEGDEIYSNELLCIKVHFHWDRDDKEPEKRSCWVPVAQIWASKNYGAQFLPRVDDEVIIAFLEGDPDHPICIGSVYTGTNKPPFPLPEQKTRSGIKTRSTKDGTADNANHLYFEDEKGKEEINVHAERNLSTSVEAAESRTVGADRTTTIQKNETLTIKEGDRTETLEEGSDSLTIVMGDWTVTLNQGDVVHNVQTGKETHTVLKDITHVSQAGDIGATAMAGSINLTAITGINLVCGASSIKMTPATIQITSPLVKINS